MLKFCILIVDDSATTRAMIKRIIEMTELPVEEVCEAEDGRKALQLMESKRVHLVLADLNMPIMGGSEMIERMHNDAALRDIPVMVISATPDDEQIEELKKNGVVGYLPKPFTPEGVRDLIGPLLKPLAFAVKSKDVRVGVKAGLAEALGEALETMAFISLELPEADAPVLPASAPRRVRVGFHGRGVNGSLTITAPSQFGAVVSSNCGSDDSNTAAADALKELANVTCGLLLRGLEGGATGFELDPPVMDQAGDIQGIFVSHDSVVLMAEGYRVVADVTTDSQLTSTQGEAA
jgi:two-component system chemotaxis response regulator CheY